MDERDNLYDYLTASGATVEQLGSKEQFKSSLNSEDAATTLYDNATKTGIRLPDREIYNSLIYPSFKIEQRKKDKVASPITRLTDGGYIERALEDAATSIAPPYSPDYKPTTYEGVYNKYNTQFGETAEGKQAKSKLDDIGGALATQYSARMALSPEYRAIATSTKSEEKKKADLQQLWENAYLPKLQGELKPYGDEYATALDTRYGTVIDREVDAINKSNNLKTYDSINQKITDTFDKNQRHSGSDYFYMQGALGGAPVDSYTNSRGGRLLNTAISLQDNSRKLIEEGTGDNWDTFIGGVGRGFADEVFNFDNYTMGLASLGDGKRILATLEKYDKGGKLTEEEDILLDAVVNNAATEAYYRNAQSRGYKAGSSVAQSIPYMIDFAFGGVALVRGATSAAAKGLAKALAKEGAETASKRVFAKTGKKLSEMSAKELAQNLTGRELASYIAKDFAKGTIDAALYAGTLGMGNTLDHYTSSSIGNIQTIPNDDVEQRDGFIRVDADPSFSAFARAFGTVALETHSEMLGNQIAPIVSKIGGAAGKVQASKVGKMAGNMAGSKAFQRVMGTANKFGIQGFIEEFLEEEYNMLGNLVIGEISPKEYKDLDNHIDTAIAVATMTGAFKTVGAAAYGREKYIVNKAIRGFETDMGAYTDWAKLKTEISEASLQDVRNMYLGLIQSDLSPEDKKARMTYMSNVLRAKALSQATPEYDTVPEEQAQAVMRAMSKAEQAIQHISPEVIKQAEEQGIETIDNISEADSGLLADYVEAKANMQSLDNTIALEGEAMAQQAVDNLLPMANNDMGVFIGAKIAGVETPVPVIGGVIQFDKDGTPTNTTDPFYYIEDGKPKVGSISSIESAKVLGTIDEEVEKTKAKAKEEVNAKWQALMAIQPEVDYMGKTVVVGDKTGEVIGRTASGDYTVDLGDEVVQVSAANMKLQEEEQPTPAKIQRDEKGNPLYHLSPVEDTVNELLSQLSPEQALQLAINNINNIEKKKRNAPKIGTNVEVFKAKQAAFEKQQVELDKQGAYWVSVRDAIAAQISPQQQVVVDATAEEAPIEEEPTPVEEIPTEQPEEKPVDKNGEPVYHLWEVDDTVDYIVENHESEADASEFIDIRLEMARRERAKAKPPKKGGSIAQNKANQQAYEESLQQLDAMVDYWEMVRLTFDEISPPAVDAAVETEVAEEQPQQSYTEMSEEDTVNDLLDGSLPIQSVNELIAYNIAKAKRRATALRTARNKVKPPQKKDIKVDGSKESFAERDAKYEEAMAAYGAKMKEYDDRIFEQEYAAEYWNTVKGMVAERSSTSEAATKEEVGAGTIKEKWDSSPKVYGNKRAKALPDGSTLNGRYVLVEAGAATPSHNPFNGWESSAGFPTTDNGRNINDRDYQTDKSAQLVTEEAARTYDARALENVPTVSMDGVVVDGNGRTMAGDIAAKNGTDGKYIEQLISDSESYGFSRQQVASMTNPRVLFEIDSDVEYTTEFFAKFNQNEKKTRNATQNAISLGGALSDKTKTAILSIIERYSTLDAFFASPTAASEIIKALENGGVLKQSDIAEMLDGDVFSEVGKSYVTDVVLGSLFSPEAILNLGSSKSVKRAILRAASAITENAKLGEMSIIDKLNQVIVLISEAKRANMPLSLYIRQGDMFQDSPIDRFGDFVVLTALELEKSVENFREILGVYNRIAKDAVGGQVDMFTGKATTIDDITKQIVEIYGREQRHARGVETSDTESVNTDSGRGKRRRGKSTDRRAADKRVAQQAPVKSDDTPLSDDADRVAIAREVAERMGLDIHIIEDVEQLPPSEGKAIREIRKGNRGVRGWFNPNTGEAYIYAPHIVSVLDTEQTIWHEIVAHKGMRKLLGKEYNNLLRSVWASMSDSAQRKMIAYAIQSNDSALVDAAMENEKAQFEAADEYIARLAEGGIEDATVWEQIKAFVRDFIANLGINSEVTDDDIRNLLRASYANLQRGDGNVDSNSNSGDARFRFAKTGEQFDAVRREAVEKRGIVAPNLNSARVGVVDAPEHGFDSFAQAKAWAKENIARTYSGEETGGKGDIRISKTTIDKYFSSGAINKSDNKDVHQRVVKVLPDVIRTSVEAEIHPDYNKVDNERGVENSINENVLIHRLYGAVSVGDDTYRVKVTLKESNNADASNAYSYEATKIELLAGLHGETKQGLTPPRYSNNSISATNLLQGVEKSYDKGKFLLDESEDLTDGVRFRIGEDVERTQELNGKQKQPNATYEVGDVLFRVSKSNRATIASWLGKRGDLSKGEIASFMDYVDDMDAKNQLATARWFANGVVRVPEDQPKIDQAVKVAGVAKVDPLQYNSPMELIDAHANIEVKGERIDPDAVETLSGKTVHDYGITVYDVEDSREGQADMRRIINTHFGKDSSPWCLLQGDGKGNLTEASWNYWNRYNGVPKRVAFKDGRLLAFCASDSKSKQWWDRQDAPSSGIPMAMKMPNDELGRTATYEYDEGSREIANNPTNIHKGNKVNGVYEWWNDNGELEERIMYKDGKKHGVEEVYFESGEISTRTTYSDGKKNGVDEHYREGGDLYYRRRYKNGELDGVQESWKNGSIVERLIYKDGEWVGIDDDIRFRTVEQVNEVFNEELGQQIDGSLPKGHVYSLGMPSDVLLASGVQDLPIELSADRLSIKSSSEYKSNHPFSLESLQNLPLSLNSPIAVFDSKTKSDAKVVLIDLSENGNNFVVALQVRKSDDSRKIDLEVNDIRSLYPKDRKGGINKWIEDGLMRWVDKEKAIKFLSTQEPNYLGGGKESNSLSSAAKVVESFENPSVEDVNNGEDVRFRTVEEQGIVDAAVGDGSYMKAPNGKPTKLSEKQWVQVRTKAFKDWFGDWERSARIEKLRGSEPVVISGEEYQGKYELNRDSAKQWLKDNLRGEYVNKDTNERIEVSKVGINKVTSHGSHNDAHLKSLIAIPSLIEKSIFIDEVSNEKTNDKYDSYRYYVAGLKIGGVDYTAKVVVGVKQGVKYYDHTLLEIEKSSLVEAANGFKTTGNASVPSYTEVKDKRLVSLLQTNSSKVVDENGEPLVVYHTTNNSFTTFDLRKSKEGFFFSPNRERLAGYMKSNTEPYFLNIKNPSGDFIAPNNSNGYDGVMEYGYIKDKTPERLYEIIAFSPNQIKSATDNTGAFSGESDDIRFRMSDTVETLSDSLNTPVNIIDNVEDITDTNKQRQERKRKSKGWYDVASGEVYVIPSNHTSKEDLQATIFHEVVGHKGLRATFGDSLDTSLDFIYNSASKEIRDTIDKRKESRRVATEEYIAELAQRGLNTDSEVALWSRFKAYINMLLNKLGFSKGFEITDNELRYILLKGKKKLNENNVFDLAEDIALQSELGVGEYFRDGSQDAYNKRTTGKLFNTQEAFVDNMASLVVLQEEVARVSGKKIEDFENAYQAENPLSSKNERESEKFYRTKFEPINKSVAELEKLGKTYEEINDYLMLKHGVERNVELSIRKYFAGKITTLEKARKRAKTDEDIESINLEIEAIRKQRDDFEKAKKKIATKMSIGSISSVEYLEQLTKLAEDITEISDNSGTMMILAAGKPVEELEGKPNELAIAEVKEFESGVNGETIKTLWKNIRSANDYTLVKSYKGGLIGKDMYDRITGMYSFYVPLRGFKEKVATDVYDYMNSDEMVSNVPKITHETKGRPSIADEPLAVMANMAEYTIAKVNRNEVKKNLFALAKNHRSDLLTVKKAVYVFNPDSQTWDVSYPDITEEDSIESIEAKIAAHDSMLEDARRENRVETKRSKLDIDYKIGKRTAKEHEVPVYINGEEYVVFVNGNPRAAQAVNGQLAHESGDTLYSRNRDAVLRFMAKNFTTRNIDFVMTNFFRDSMFSHAAILIKESKAYYTAFIKSDPWLEVKNGTIFNGGSPLFEEFLANGGETGYLSVTDVDAFKKKIKNDIKKLKGDGNALTSSWRWVSETLSDFNRFAELLNRFAVYKTSRNFGRSIERSISDAKNITVNFNRKGAGNKGKGAAGMTAGFIRNHFLFANAAIQSANNAVGLAKTNPIKFTAVTGTVAVLGTVVPMLMNKLLAGLLGDDGEEQEQNYFDLPLWIRRNNICIYAGNGKYVTIPIAHELRPFYGIGEMIYGHTSGYEKLTAGEMTLQVLSNFSAMLPIDPLGEEGGALRAVIPDYAKPVYDAYVSNKSFSGIPVAKTTVFNELDPEYKRVYNGVGSLFTGGSKFLSEISGGNEFRRGSIEINPAKVEHLAESYFGGLWRTASNIAKTVSYAVGDGDASVSINRFIPIVNRFVSTVDDRTINSRINSGYYEIVDRYKGLDHEFSNIKKQFFEPKYQKMYSDFTNRDEFVNFYIPFGEEKKLIDKLNSMKKEVESIGGTPDGIDIEIKNLQKEVIEKYK